MAHPGDTPSTFTPPPDDVELEITTVEIDPQSIVPVSEMRRTRQDEAGSSRAPSSPTLRYFCEETCEYRTYHGRECRCGASRSFPDTLVYSVEQERDYLAQERTRLADERDLYRTQSETFQRIATRARDRVEVLEAGDMVRSAEIAGHMISIDLLRDELAQVQGQSTVALGENASLRSQIRRQEALLDRFRQLVPDWEDHLAESDGDETELWHDELGGDHEMWQVDDGADVEVEPDEPLVDEEIEVVEPEMDAGLDPIEPVTSDAMDLSEQGSDDDEEPSEHDDEDDEDYDADAERDDSSDDSDGDAGDYFEPEAGWLME